jgi:hypothetical protein
MKTLKSFNEFVLENAAALNEDEPKVQQQSEVKPEEEKEEAAENPTDSIKEEPKEEEEEKKSASDLLKECCEMMKSEAKVWEEDAHDEHTIESYMCEAASLMGNYCANSLKEMKEEYALEAYEAACNSMKEAFCKKIDEAKDSNMAPQAPEDLEPSAKA